MMLCVCSVRDKAVGAYLQPFFARSKGEAIRSFSDAANSDKHQFSVHPEHYALYYHGEFDDVTGVFDCLDAPVVIVSGVECLAVGQAESSRARAVGDQA